MWHPLLSPRRWLFSVAAVAAKPRFAVLRALAVVFALSGCSAGAFCDPGSLTSCLSCAAPLADCNRDSDDGCEVNTAEDPNHCGRCDKACPGVGQQRALCGRGTCALCPSGRLDCNGLGSDGCETKVNTDPQNCGRCGLVCPAVRNGVAGCIDSSCTIARCQQGFEDCDGNPLNGCETDTRADPRSCGGCAAVCPSLPNAQVVCRDGACGVDKCNDGFGSCDPGSPLVACQTNLNTDVYNCGDCGLRCPAVATGARSCVLGKCGAKACDSRWQDCNKSASDGCEVDTQQDAVNCGTCGTSCAATAAPNTVATCQLGKCGFVMCLPGYADCDNNPNNGCEVNLTNSINNCGACNNSCGDKPGVASFSCENRQCVIKQCAVGLTDCDGQFNNGCEANLTNSRVNCGTCGNVCGAMQHALGACVSGSCQITYDCETGYSNCDSTLNNGCETANLTDRNHCGSCRRKCAAGQFCADGQCVP